MPRSKKLIGLAAAVAVLCCSGTAFAATIDGSSASDTLLGTATNDLIRSLDGDDTVIAFGGNDRIVGGSGDDTLDGDGVCPTRGIEAVYCIPPGGDSVVMPGA